MKHCRPLLSIFNFHLVRFEGVAEPDGYGWIGKIQEGSSSTLKMLPNEKNLVMVPERVLLN